MDYLLFAAGLAMLLWGGDRVVASALLLADRLGVSAMATGVLVVGLGTSLPELVASVDAALQGSDAIAIGNVVGSNIANILLVLGVGALCLPIGCNPASMRRDLPCMVLASAAVLAALQLGELERWMGVSLVLAMAAYAGLLLRGARLGTNPDRVAPARNGVLVEAARAAFGIVMLAGGAHLLVTGGLGIARLHGVSEAVIGLALLALGTSLPELSTAIMAVVRRRHDVAVGNIVGSTLFNLLGILGVTAMVTPLTVPDVIARFDAWVMLAAVLSLALFARTGWRINRVEGGALLLAYPAYLIALLR